MMNVKTVYVEITNQCNLNCRTCYNRSGLNKMRREISCEQLKHIICTFRPLGMERLLISGGEPTLHSEFDAILDLPAQFPDLAFGVVTNGTHYHQKLIDTVNTTPHMSLQISLDGSCEDINRLTRGAGHFEKAVAFAKQIRKAEPKPLLKMVISQQNAEDVEAFCDLALSLGFLPEFAFISKSGNGSDLWEQKGVTTQQKMQTLKTLEAQIRKHQVDIFLPTCTNRCPFSGELHDLSLCVKTDGSIQPCQSLYDKEYSVGNVFSFDADTFTRNMSKIGDLAKQRTDTDYNCKSCMIAAYCGKGCIAEAISLCGDPLGDDHNCDWRKQVFIHTQLLPHIGRNNTHE